MKKTRRTASACWKSGARGGTQSISTESGTINEAQFTLGMPLKSSPRTNPAELVAAALVSSFSLALSSELKLLGTSAGVVISTATVNSENLTGGWAITDINLNVDAKLPKVTQGTFIDAAVRAKMSCMVCQLLRANISMNAKLAK